MSAQRRIVPPALAQLETVRLEQVCGEGVLQTPIFLDGFFSQSCREHLGGVEVLWMEIELTENDNHSPLWIGCTTAVASISISHSGRTSRLTNTNALTGGFSTLIKRSRISRRTGSRSAFTLSTQ